MGSDIMVIRRKRSPSLRGLLRIPGNRSAPDFVNRRSAVIVLAVSLGACAGLSAVRDEVLVLRDPARIPLDVAVRQRIAVRASTPEGERAGSFDAVLQKRGAELIVVGLGAAGVRTFVLRQTGSEVTFEQRFGPPLPVSPRRIVQDIHRVFFRTAPVPVGGEGERTASSDGETLTDRWEKGSLVERRIVGSDGERVVILFGEGCTVKLCQPKSAVLTSETRRYSLTISNDEFLP